MIVIMQPGATPEEVDSVKSEICRFGFRPFENPGVERKVIALLGEVDFNKADLVDTFNAMPGVSRAELISNPWKLASRDFHPKDTIVEVGSAKFGGGFAAIAAGPCSVESLSQMRESALCVKAAGARLLRGGAFKPRTSPYSFQGMGEDGLKIMAEVREETGLPIVTEVMSEEEVELVDSYADVLQIGARNVQNYALLKQVGQTRTPVLLKRGFGTKIKDFVMSAEYIMAGGNTQVILCERGITTFEDSCRNTTDINAVPVLKKLTHLPVVLDPSHATGKADYVPAIAKAGLAAGCDGLIIEMHPDPAHAASDGAQSLNPKAFAQLMEDLRRIAAAVDKTL
ncbi:MAG TPA: 3-deoxy-7-phosphoheptulonate synthase [Armatimonadota bacterium]|jgi:3-deoxy-7-phosphoheptulonate synthase